MLGNVDDCGQPRQARWNANSTAILLDVTEETPNSRQPTASPSPTATCCRTVVILSLTSLLTAPVRVPQPMHWLAPIPASPGAT